MGEVVSFAVDSAISEELGIRFGVCAGVTGQISSLSLQVSFGGHHRIQNASVLPLPPAKSEAFLELQLPFLSKRSLGSDQSSV